MKKEIIKKYFFFVLVEFLHSNTIKIVIISSNPKNKVVEKLKKQITKKQNLIILFMCKFKMFFCVMNKYNNAGMTDTAK